MTPEEQAAADAAAKAKADADKAAADAAVANVDGKKYDEAYVARLRREAQDANKKVADLEKKDSEREAAEAKDKDDQKKLAALEKKRADELQAKLDSATSKSKQRVLKSELRTAAQAAGLLDLDDIALIDASKIEFDSDDEPIGVDALIATFKAAKPNKFKLSTEAQAALDKEAADAAKAKADADKLAGRRPVAAASNAAAGKKDAKDMSDDEFEKEWAGAGKQ